MRRKLTAWAASILLSVYLATPVAAGAFPVPDPDVPAEPAGTFVIDNGGFERSVASVTAELKLESGSDVRAYVYDAQVPADTPIATGLFLHWLTVDGAEARREQVVVIGDVTGTGKAGIGQVTRIARALSGREPLEGIWLEAGDLDGSGRIDLSDIVQAAAQLQAVTATAAGDFAERIVPMYLETPHTQVDVPLYFAPGQDDIPFVSVSTIQSVLNRIFSVIRNDVLHKAPTESTATAVVYGQNGQSAAIDFAAGEIRFANRNAFFAAAGAPGGLDAVSLMPVLDDGTPAYIERAPGSFGRDGRPVTIRLGDYGIVVTARGTGGFIPLQTFSDIFLTPLGCCAAWNGRFVGLASLREPDALLSMYYSAPTGERSAELASFTYNEFCLAMDLCYGLKSEQNIAGFDALLRQTGLYNALHSKDPVIADSALKTLATGYLGDIHTQLAAPSFYAGQDADIKTYASSIALDRYRAAYQQAAAARTAAFPAGAPGYQEIGHTAFVTFDSFRFDAAGDYSVPAAIPDSADTVRLIAYAHQQIRREGSPVRTVVLDLSCNSGGDLDAAVYALGWLLGTATIDLNDSQTGAQASLRYRADVNFDGRYDSEDTLGGLSIACLVSPASFSAANLAATVLKGTSVQLIGQQTGGGSCAVLPLSLADGSVMRISGPVHTSALENGSYYDTDRGVVPDYRLNTYADFYDRETLCRVLDDVFAAVHGE